MLQSRAAEPALLSAADGFRLAKRWPIQLTAACFPEGLWPAAPGSEPEQQ